MFLDSLMVVLAFGVAYYIRFYTEIISTGIQTITIFQTFIPVLLGIPINLFYYSILELYHSKRHFGVYEAMVRIVKANTYSILTIVSILFLLKISDFSRWTLVLNYGFNIIFTTLVYYLMIKIIERVFEDGSNLRRCLVLGNNDISERFFENLENNSSWGLNIIGVLDDDLERHDTKPYVNLLGRLEDLSNSLIKYEIDVVIIALVAKDYMQLGNIFSTCEKAGVKTHIIPTYHKYVPARPYMDDLDGLPIMDVRHVPLDNVLKSFLKRTFDILFSIFAIVLSSPVLLVSAMLTKITSPGPVLFKQERVGLNRKPFVMYKFRSMCIQDPKDEKCEWTTQNDPRKTKWGQFMRKMSIDELPQFFNVLKGDMSVIGPRPERPYFVKRFKEEIPRYMIKHQVRPGISGWAQVCGWRGDTSIERRIEHDLYYIENWTFAFDIKIIILTVLKGFINRNAY
jgi:Undecaprenyl-phosphate glucose phosphotransferase